MAEPGDNAEGDLNSLAVVESSILELCQSRKREQELKQFNTLSKNDKEQLKKEVFEIDTKSGYYPVHFALKHVGCDSFALPLFLLIFKFSSLHKEEQ